MLKVLRQGQRWIMGFVILVVGGVFVAFVGTGGPLHGRGGPGGDSVVEVDGHHFTTRDLQRARAQQEEEAKRVLGDAYDAKAVANQLDLMAANTLVQSGILAREAEHLGLRVSDEEIVEVVKQIPAFKDEQGQFRPDAVKGYIQYEYGTERRFLESLRQQLLAQKVLKLIADTAAVSDPEARDALQRQKEAVSFAYVALDTTTPPKDVEITDAQVDALLAKSEPRVKEFYDAHPERFNAAEKVRARHILLRVPKDATEAQAADVRKRADALRERLLRGEDFAKLASEASEDPGSKDKGGDLGFFQRGQMVKPFEDVAFAMEAGALSDVVKSDFGYHLIQVQERKPAESRSLDDVKREIAKELVGADVARAEARKRADLLAGKVRSGASLQDAARADALTLERTELLHRRPDGFIPNLGASPEVMAAAFALTKEKPSSDRVYEVSDKLVLVQLLDRKEPSADELTKELPATRQRLLEEEKNRIQSAWLQSRQQSLTAAGKLKVELGSLQQRP
jgi:peptidyl-prolyl cis-trans isomerase D